MAAVLLNVPLIVRPPNVFAPVALVMVNVPVTVVIPVTARLNAPTVSVDPLAIFKVAHAAFAAIVTVRLPSINTTSPAIGAEAPEAPPDVADHVAVDAQLPVATE